MSSHKPAVVVVWTDPPPPPRSASAPALVLQRQSRDLRSAIRHAFVLGVPLAYLALLLVGPLLAVLRGAFEAGIGTFFSAISSRAALHAFGLTAAMTALAIVLNTVFGVAAAWVFCRDRFPGRALLGGLVDLPFAVSPVVVGLMAMLLFGSRGLFGPLLASAGVRLLFSWPAIALVTTFVSLPCVVREVTPVLQEIGRSEEEAARILGASRVQTFIHVVLPNIRWGIAYGCALTAARTMGEFGGVLLVSGGLAGSTETATLLIYRHLEERQEPAAHAIAIVLACASVLLLVAMELVKRRRNRDLEEVGSQP